MFQPEGVRADCHLHLLHDFQKRGLHLRRGAVNLVREQQVGKYRSLFCRELSGGLVIDACADQVGGKQVRGELYAREAEVQSGGQGFYAERLGKAGYSFKEDMPAREKPGQQPVQHLILPDDDLLHLAPDIVQYARVGGDFIGEFFKIRGH